MDTIIQRAQEYVQRESDDFFRQEVETLLAKQDYKELEDRFYRDLEFGTGGLRGIIGGGYNRMNSFVVRRATQGLCDYLLKTFPGKQLSGVIAYDSRRYSAQFALDTALIFAANGIKAYLFTGVRPTPVLSFAIQHLKTDTGVVITASHNPPAYNGYKAYWNDGAQIIPPHDKGIITCVNNVSQIKFINKEEALQKGLLVYIDSEVDNAYKAMVKQYLHRKDLIKELGKQAKIVYTPLHGTGAVLFEAVMSELGLNVITVPEQREPDGEFPTVSYPNPEEAPALKMAVELGKKEKADVVMATDPDADRLGIAVPDREGKYVLITGNQLGALHLDYILLTLKELGKMPKRPGCIKTIVTTDLHARIAEYYGAECHECLTGFKWIASVMRRFEQEGIDFVYGTEESYGHLIEKEVQDKDGISAAAITAEMTLYWRSKGKSLLDRLNDLYMLHGYHEEKGINKYFEGSSGMEKMQTIMANYRSHQPETLGGIRVTKIRDIKTGEFWDTNNPHVRHTLDLPSSDVIQWYLEDGTMVTVRPSGTEPKIKYYILARDVAGKPLDEARAAVARKIEAIEKDIYTVLETE
ncbi:MAG TPA: phospho-sugar mutase [Spirochaetales bacterium]|nr:phospho-sugar mutase [Spirochaetales bacterium]HRV28340.1 phospho-sugar mutase [Spirochaetia bacterium]